jgi:hypothetical protein
VDDLRGVDLAGEAVRYGLMGSFLLHALLVRGDCVDLARSGGCAARAVGQGSRLLR